MTAPLDLRRGRGAALASAKKDIGEPLSATEQEVLAAEMARGAQQNADHKRLTSRNGTRANGIPQGDTASNDTPAPTIRALGEWRAFPELWQPPPAIVQDVLYPGTVTLIAAREKMGKTSLVAQMVAALSVGGWFLGAQVPRCRVLWYAMDEPLGAALVRFDRLRADDALLVTRERPESPDHFRHALAVHRPEVVVFDSLGDLWEGKVDSNSHDDTRAYFKPYIRATREVNAAVVPIYHTNASATKYAGAVAIGAMVDAPLLLKPRGQVTGEDGEDLPDDGRRLLEGRTRYGVVRIPLSFANGLYQRGEDPPPLALRVLQALATESQSQNALRSTLNVRMERLTECVQAHLGTGLIARTGKQLGITQEGLSHLAGNVGKQAGNSGKRLGSDPGTPASASFPENTPRRESGKQLDEDVEVIE